MSIIAEPRQLSASPYISSKTQHSDEFLERLFESSLGSLLKCCQDEKQQKQRPLLDQFQMELFRVMNQASDEGISNFMDVKATQLNRFLIAMFVASLHKAHPLRANESVEAEATKTTEQREEIVESAEAKEEKELKINATGHSSSSINTEKDLDQHDQDDDTEVPEVYEYSTEDSTENKTTNGYDEFDEYDHSHNHNHNHNHNHDHAQEHETTEHIILKEWKELFQVKSKPEQSHQHQHQQDHVQPSSIILLNHTDHVSPLLPSSRLDTPNLDDKQLHQTPSPKLLPSSLVLYCWFEINILYVYIKGVEEIGLKQNLADELLLREKAELIAPMTVIPGVFELYSTRFQFLPDEVHPTEKVIGKCNTIATTTTREQSPTISSTFSDSESIMVSRELSFSVGPVENANQTHCKRNNAKGDEEEQQEREREREQEPDGDESNPSRNGGDKSKSSGKATKSKRDLCVTVTACGSYTHLGGNRYRVMSAYRDWQLKELTQMYDRRYRLQKCALELYFKDDTSWLFQFFEESIRNRVMEAILNCKPPHLSRTGLGVMVANTAINGGGGSNSGGGSSVGNAHNGGSNTSIGMPLQMIESSQMHWKWRRREISNFEYLMNLNMLAGRTFNDLTQYPVMPWVLRDYTSDTIDLNDPNVYRDLTKPIGALNPKRLETFIERYNALLGTSDPNDPTNPNNWMYGSHYSSIGIVLYYLVRMEPFTTCSKIMQGGKLDCADRLFYSIAECFDSCLHTTGDVKELIPEFYYSSEFLVNRNNIVLGKKQNGEVLSHVKLPPWAKQSARTFVEIMRQALESEYVSDNLHHWIDLIFGYKQRLPEAGKCFNLFHPYTYEGNVDIDAVHDPVEKKSILAQIDSFGQTPAQLFFKPHPKRYSVDSIASGSAFRLTKEVELNTTNTSRQSQDDESKAEGILKKGWMQTEEVSDAGKQIWLRRLFTLHSDLTLRYNVTLKEKKMEKRTIDLRHLQSLKMIGACGFEVVVQNKVWKFECKEATDREEWITYINPVARSIY
ncbi:BEACH domain-containing protein [Reticulomyxa filosa]|uniref:BEACH domain-containing protein n=1 Tax=Reticulomyxa filosa TaxID=46433 RepID=X6M254_RETFI|nr:BEACH domain-containing protein [Reticulomyxa filosa]|eukprot:ETO07487.1 BEACH domain-containing protein [Reticulomyxa filosa]